MAKKKKESYIKTLCKQIEKNSRRLYLLLSQEKEEKLKSLVEI